MVTYELDIVGDSGTSTFTNFGRGGSNDRRYTFSAIGDSRYRYTGTDCYSDGFTYKGAEGCLDSFEYNGTDGDSITVTRDTSKNTYTKYTHTPTPGKRPKTVYTVLQFRDQEITIGTLKESRIEAKSVEVYYLKTKCGKGNIPGSNDEYPFLVVLRGNWRGGQTKGGNKKRRIYHFGNPDESDKLTGSKYWEKWEEFQPGKTKRKKKLKKKPILQRLQEKLDKIENDCSTLGNTPKARRSTVYQILKAVDPDEDLAVNSDNGGLVEGVGSSMQDDSGPVQHEEKEEDDSDSDSGEDDDGEESETAVPVPRGAGADRPLQGSEGFKNDKSSGFDPESSGAVAGFSDSVHSFGGGEIEYSSGRALQQTSGSRPKRAVGSPRNDGGDVSPGSPGKTPEKPGNTVIIGSAAGVTVAMAAVSGGGYLWHRMATRTVRDMTTFF